MKKLFFLAAALVAAVSMNAADYTGFDGRDGSLGQQIYDGVMVTDIDNILLNETDPTAHKYEIKIENGGECSFYMGDIEFWYSNTNAGTIAYKSYGTYIQPNGNKRKITIPVSNPGDKVYVYVQDGESNVALEGATVEKFNFVGWGPEKALYNEITAAAGSNEIVIWSDDRVDGTWTAHKLKLGAILYNVPTAVENVEAVKTVKTIENGQMVIIRNGVKYNANGMAL